MVLCAKCYANTHKSGNLNELSGNSGRLVQEWDSIVDRVAEAIRAEPGLDETPWSELPDERKSGWRGDARRALAVVKDHLTTQGIQPVSDPYKSRQGVGRE